MDESFYSDPRNMMNMIPEDVRPDRYLTADDARVEVKEMCDMLLSVFDRLHSVVLAHEAVIRKRWAKKTMAKKRSLLQEAYPEIPQEHASEVKAFENTPKLLLHTRRDTFLLPFINIEDLTAEGGAHLMSLLHYRAHLFPSDFAQFDDDMLHFGVVSTAVKRAYVDGCAVLSYGDRSTYGTVVDWGEYNDDGFDGQLLDFRGDALSGGDALTVFEMQTKLLKFLLLVAEKLLWDTDLSSLPLPSSVSALPPPDVPVPKASYHGWVSTARQHNLRAYLHPEGFSIDSLSALVKSQYDLAVDELIEMRNDPVYLSERLRLYVDHRLESASVGTKAPPSMINDRAATFLLNDAYSNLCYWKLLKDATERATAVRDTAGQQVRRAREIPKAWADALQDIHTLLTDMEFKAKADFPRVLCASPPFRKYFSVRFQDTNFQKNQISSQGKGAAGDKLLATLLILLDEQNTHLWQVNRLYDDLDTFVSSSPEQRDRISPLLAQTLTYRGTVNDALNMLDRHRPRLDAEDKKAQADRYRRIAMGLMGGFARHDRERVREDIRLGTVAFPLNQFKYPKGPKTEEWARRCEAVDDAMSTFWASAERQMKQQAGAAVDELVQGLWAPHLGHQVSWASYVRQKPTKPPAQPRTQNMYEPQEIPLSVGAITIVPPKAKVKTRGKPSTSRLEEEEPTPSALDGVADVEAMHVSARVYKTFQSLFRMSSDSELNSQQGSVAWSDILYAFEQLGFSGVKGRGSAWSFMQELNGQSRRFTVHEPHPKISLDFWEARRLGRRLTRRFGWTGEHFVHIMQKSDEA